MMICLMESGIWRGLEFLFVCLVGFFLDKKKISLGKP